MASATFTHSLQSLLLLNSHCRLTIDSNRERLMGTWMTIYNMNTPGLPSDTKQSVWDRPGIIDHAVVMSAFTDNFNRARLLAASASHSADWLHALPLSTCGLRLDNETVRVAVGLRLGPSLCEPHQCPCGKQVDARGTHDLSCKRGDGRSIRHHQLNDIKHRALTRASTPSVLESPGLSRTDGKRPDGLTLILWQRGKSLTWDVTVTDTVADSCLHLTSTKAGGAAENIATRKDKYVDLQQRTRSSHWRSKRLDPLTSKAWNFCKSRATASQPSATTTVRLHSCSNESSSRCSG